ncbi:MAG: 4Fe-4S ferredoxin [Sedimenticola sp.]|nr:MAG: 4Fe-4S ferredoxin [Sedimenticola sp.]
MNDKVVGKAKKIKPAGRRREQERREFLRTAVLAAGVTGFSLLGLIPAARGDVLRLRPPGALKTPNDEQEYLASCIKCGQCVQVCPVEAIILDDLQSGVGVGTPYINARDQACDFSCDGLQCVLACPTGALTHDLNYPAESRMGFAELSRPKACLAIQGKGFKGLARGADYKGKLRYDEIDRWNPIQVADHPYDLELCDLCVRQCPIEIRISQCAEGKPPSGDQNQCPPQHAIALEPVDGATNGAMVPVIKEGCVGCGVCEMVCPPEPPAIVINIEKFTDMA